MAESGDVPLHIADIGDGDDPAVATEELRSRYELNWFDYENEFPVRMGVVRQSGTLKQIVVCYSHVMLDGGGLDALNEDLTNNLNRITGEPTAPPEGLHPLELARKQGGPAARRQSERAIQYWADQLERLPVWRHEEPVGGMSRGSPNSSCTRPRWNSRCGRSARGPGPTAPPSCWPRTRRRSRGCSGAIRASPRSWTSNRFRPGLAGMVSQVSQHGICVVDAADASFDEIVARAQKAVTSASFYAYYDPVARDTAGRRDRRPQGAATGHLLVPERPPRQAGRPTVTCPPRRS